MPQPLWKQSTDVKERVKGRVGPQQPPHSPAQPPTTSPRSTRGTPAGPSPAEPWPSHGPVSGSVLTAPAGHTSGQRRLPGWGRSGPGSRGFVGAPGGRARPELLRSSHSRPGCTAAASRGSALVAVNAAPRAACLHPRGWGPKQTHTKTEGHGNVRSERGLKEAFRCLKDSLQKNPHKAASGLLQKHCRLGGHGQVSSEA